MTSELYDWISDLSNYLRFGLERAVRPFLLDQGIDYADPKYKDIVRKVIERIHPHRMQIELTEVIRETASTKTFRFRRTDGEVPPFRAGQYVNLFLEIDGVRTSRPYSMSSAPGENHLDLTVRKKSGGFVSPYLLAKAQPGDAFESTGPAGSFYHEPLIDGTDLVFLAGGSGITPFMSILRDQAKRGWPLSITLLYGSRVTRDIIFGKELKELAKKNDKLKYALVISEPAKSYKGLTGFLTADRIKEQVGDVEDKTFSMCGPNVMYDFVQPELEKMGVPRHKIKRELYGPPDDVTRQPGWPKKVKATQTFSVEVAGEGTIPARAGEPLINSLERAKRNIPALCRSGECSYCRTKIISGKVFMPENTGIRESDRVNGYVHACVAYPLEDLVIRLENRE